MAWMLADIGPGGNFSGVKIISLEATASAFAAPPSARPITAKDLPIGRRLLIAGTVSRPLGLDDLQRQLAARSS